MGSKEHGRPRSLFSLRCSKTLHAVKITGEGSRRGRPDNFRPILRVVNRSQRSANHSGFRHGTMGRWTIAGIIRGRVFLPVFLALIVWVAEVSGKSTAEVVPRSNEIRVLLQVGKVEEAVAASRRLITNPRTEFNTLLEVGQLLAERKILPEARAAFT